MQMPDISNLGLIDEPIEVDPDNLPSEGGALDPVPQPGTKTWQLPTNLADHISDEGVFNPIQTPGGQRFAVVLKDDFKLKNLTDGTEHRYRFSNQERSRGDVKVSDLAYLLSKVGIKPETNNNTGYLKAFLKACAQGKTFMADVSLSSRCSADRDIYTEEGKKEGVKGCGTRYDQDGYTIKNGPNAGTVVHKIPRVDGKVPDQFECGKCAAILRPWMNLRRFKEAK